MTDPALLHVLTRIADSLERMSPKPASADVLDQADVHYWDGANETLHPVHTPSGVPLRLLKGLDRQIAPVLSNTRHFARGFNANNVMLWGARGMGKSSLVKATLAAVNEEQRARHEPALALIEIPRDALASLPRLLALLRQTKRRCILFCDDLSFESQDADYKSLKSVLDGGVAGRPDNVVLYATSNRRHLMPRDMIENETGSAINPSEAIEEKVSLSDRFGLWIGLYGATQDDYLAIIYAYAEERKLTISNDDLRRRALQWAMTRGSRSGRVAAQFIDNLEAELAT
ncbi:ATP-dependent protease subunit [Neokomagataea thailandica NBRC 106555]|uniref:ATP-binding protein n=2 Tax=Neokomagataea TaxID=1223423 RepID=A0A4Y6V8W8_9PROT|nr:MULTISPECIES: ATP-binding protein [Neokomagataea]QDH24815.1 ATP-binding protein [Neokomagataea tanensis]GBR50030.1 ATP-dependent protease subunit [Neokomagataea thailandica NBRC 106555]